MEFFSHFPGFTEPMGTLKLVEYLKDSFSCIKVLIIGHYVLFFLGGGGGYFTFTQKKKKKKIKKKK